MSKGYETGLALRLDSKIFLYEEAENPMVNQLSNLDGPQSVGYNVYETYAIKGGNPITTNVTQWNPEGPPNTNARLLDWERRSDLRGVTLRNSWFEDPPYIVYIRDRARNLSSSW